MRLAVLLPWSLAAAATVWLLVETRRLAELAGGFEVAAALRIRIDGTAEESGVGEIDQAEGVEGGSGEEAEGFTAGEAEAEREESEPEVLAAFPEGAAVVGRLVGQGGGAGFGGVFLDRIKRMNRIKKAQTWRERCLPV